MARVKTATRTISNAGRLRTLVVVASPKAQGILATESLAEYTCLKLALFDPDVVSIRVQPMTVQVAVDGEPRAYTPDAEYIHADGHIGLREFKWARDSLDEEDIKKLSAASRQLGKDGYEFKVVFANELDTGHLVRNVTALRRYADWPITDLLKSSVFQFLDCGATRRTLGDLRELVGPAGVGAVLRMLWEGAIQADLTGMPLDRDTPVWKSTT